MYRDLIPKLAGRYHVIAPDLPGFGHSDHPAMADFAYTFAHYAEVMDAFPTAIGEQKYCIYGMDYGSAERKGLSPFWAEFLVPYWKERNPETEKKARTLLTLDLTRFQDSKGFRHPENVNPNSYTFDQMGLDRPGNAAIQLARFTDYQANLDQYPQWHRVLRRVQSAVLAVWGRSDPIFIPAGAEAFKRDVPKAEIDYLDTGRFALEEDLDAIASRMLIFLARHVC